MKLITYIQRKWIDFRCRVSEREINDYIYNHGKPKVLGRQAQNSPMGDQSKTDRKAVKLLLQVRKRRMLFNAALDEESKKRGGDWDAIYPNAVKAPKSIPLKFNHKKDTRIKYSTFRQQYWSDQPPKHILTRIYTSAKSILLKGKDIDLGEWYGGAPYHTVGTYGIGEPLDIMAKSLLNNKKVPKKVKESAKRVVEEINGKQKPITKLSKKTKKGRKQ